MGMSWINFIMDLATIPDTTKSSKDKSKDEHIAPEDEEAQLRKDFNL